ncbi:MAG: SAM-dependent methyltransferase, partial [Muribaculaceae bacterium]|nr:SAM-dependent methyltransferase [Muribaculaceae bacterium]
MTQIFIEAPYRNNKMLATLITTLRAVTMLCVACDLTDPLHESVISLPASRWRTIKADYDKRPAIFLIYSGSTVIL